MENQPVSSTQRRFFLSVVLAAIGAALAFLAGWPLLRFLAPLPREGDDGRVAIDRDRVEVGGVLFFSYRGGTAVVMQMAPGQFTAFSAICTHLGCVVQWMPQQQEFVCPCHAGRFSSTGAVLGGPPPKPMVALPVTLSGKQILIGQE